MDLTNVPSITNANQVGLNWSPGIYNGGTRVIDYRLSYKESTDTEYTIYADSIAYLPYTVTGLTAGVVYNFKVQSRNIVNYSDFSDSIAVLAAQVPDAPTSLSDVPSVTNA